MKRLLPITLAPLLVGGAVGCMVDPPPVSSPDVGLELPASYVAAAAEGERADRWWATFDDPQLSALVVEAVRNNRDLRAAAARIEVAAAEARISSADLFPQLDADFSAARQRQNFVGFPIPGSDGGEEVLSTTSNVFTLGLNVNWELDVWGRIRSDARAAAADFQALQADFASAAISLAARASRAYFTVVESRLQVELTERTVESYEETARQTADRAEEGIVSPSDRFLAVTQLEQARATLQQRRETLARSQRQLEILLGRYPAGLVEAADDLPDVPGPVPAGLPASLLYRRPDLIAAERQVAAADQRVTASERALLPRIALTANAGTQSEEFDNLLDGDFFVWTLAGNLVQPIFEGGRLRARIDANEGRLAVALENYAQTALDAFGEVETALVVEAFLAEREASLRRAVEAANAAVRVSRDRYETGIDGFIVVLEAQRRALDTESQLLTVRRLRLENRVNLHLALGDGFGPIVEALPGDGRGVLDEARTADDVTEETNSRLIEGETP